MANEIHGVKSYLTLYNETTWGTTPGSPALVYLPGTQYGVQLRRDRRNAAPFTGLRQRKHGKTFRAMPSGNLVSPLYGFHFDPPDHSLAQYLLDWSLLNHESLVLPSKGGIWAEGPNTANKRHTGLRVNQATLTGSDDAGEVELSLELMGQDEEGQTEVGSAPAIPNDMLELTDFEFTDAAFRMAEVGDSLAAVGIRSFQLQVVNNLEAVYNNSRRPSILIPAERAVSFQISLLKNSDVFDSIRRDDVDAEFHCELELRGLHKGTGTALTDWTIVTITIPRMQYATHEDNRSREELALMPLQFDVLKPDSSSNDLSIAYTEE